MKSWELERMYREEGKQEGLAEGLEQGISALIKTCREFRISRDDTLAKVMYNFRLEQEIAEGYMRKYWQES